MTAVVLIILTMIVCAGVPAVLIWLTTVPHAKMILGIEQAITIKSLLVPS
jgi:hypothetical protein